MMRASCARQVKGRTTVCTDACSKSQCARVREWDEQGYGDMLAEMVSCVGMDRVLDAIAVQAANSNMRAILEKAADKLRNEARR